MSSGNLDVFSRGAMAEYNAAGCGICEKKGADILWPSPYSKGAHEKCYEKIKSAESVLLHNIKKLFSSAHGYKEQNDAHKRAIAEVRIACGCDILTYAETKGLQALTKLFNTVGVGSIKTRV